MSDDQAVNPDGGGGANDNSAAAKILSDQLNALEATLKQMSESSGCYGEIESLIASARTQLVNGKLADAQASYEKATVAVWKAKSSAAAEPLAWQLLWIECGCLVVILALGFLYKRYPDFWLWVNLVGNSAKAAWFGALGGVTIGVYGIYTHISTKDFDRSFRLWYLCKPVMGAIFGWFVFLVYYVGVVSAGSGDIRNPGLAYLIAFLAGFSERFTIKTIDRFMTVLTVGEDPKKAKDAGGKNTGSTGGS